MYTLTDYTAAQLRVISGAIAEQIKEKVDKIKYTHSYIPEGDTLRQLTRLDEEEVSILREHHVHVLTALQIVREREMAMSN